MFVRRDFATEILAAGVILLIVSSFLTVNGAAESPRVEWAEVSNPSTSGDAAWSVAADASGIYVVGYDHSTGLNDSEWRMEKRNLNDGSIIWAHVSNPSTGEDWAMSVAVDSSGMYVVGYDSSPVDLEWRIEKRNLVDGSLIWMQTANPSRGDDTAFGVAVDASGVYVVGVDSAQANSEWRIEKRNLNDGSLVWAQVSNPSAGEDWAWGVAVDSSGIYVVGYDSVPGDLEWRIEKRNITDGEIIWTQTSNPTHGEPSGIYMGDRAFGACVDASAIYVVGFDNAAGPEDIETRIEKRSLTDGSLVWSQTSNPSLYEDRAFGVAADTSGIYVVGFDSVPGHGDLEWRVEKRSVDNGRVLWTYVSNPSHGEDWAWGIAEDASGTYVVGFDSCHDEINYEWRIEKISDKATVSPFYLQTWFIALIVASVAGVALVSAALIVHSKKK